MLTAVSPHIPLTHSPTEHLENGSGFEHQPRGQKLDVSGDSQQGYDLLSGGKDKASFGPAVVSHLRAATSAPAPLNTQTAAPKIAADDNTVLPLVKSSDRVSLSNNARELAYGVQSHRAGDAAAAPNTAPVASAASAAQAAAEVRSGNAGQRAYKAVRWNGPELVAGGAVQASASNAAVTPTVETVLNATPKVIAAAELTDSVERQAATLSAQGKVSGETGPVQAERQDNRSAVAEAAVVAETSVESEDTGFGKSVRNFFHNLRSRLWGQAVTAYSQTSTEIVRGQRLHIQV